MDLKNKAVLITGGAHGIGRALAESCHRQGALVAIADLDLVAAQRVATALDGLAFEVDVRREEDLRSAVRQTEEEFGPVHLLCSNAGVGFSDAPGWTSVSQSNEQWETAWQVNVLAHVFAVRAVLPGMIRRGGGHLLFTSSAAGLLTMIGDAAYATTKHAVIGFAESVSISHGEQGVQVSVLCPQGVDTRMTRSDSAVIAAAKADGVLPAEEVAAAALEGLGRNEFLILPHPQVREYLQRKVSAYDRWLDGMRRFRRSFFPNDDQMDLDSNGGLLQGPGKPGVKTPR
jgi:NAD(P)-dependent dehydrogenase (short-subunit alcohol dehydrogenase family)